MPDAQNTFSRLQELLCRFGIENDSRWLAVLLFVRDLVRALSHFSDDDKAAIQREVFHDLSEKDFSDERYDQIIAKIDAFIENSTLVTSLKDSLEAEKQSMQTLFDEMHDTIAAIRRSGNQRENSLQEARMTTEKAIKQSHDKEAIVARVREQFNSLIVELREEANEWEARARRLEHTARFDPLLTELHNRRALDIQLVEVVQQYHDTGTPVGLMMIDVDNFKRVNDTHGHQVGDEVLKMLARILSSQAVLFNGFAARYGGEELAAIAVGISPEETLLIAEAIRHGVEGTRFVPEVKGYEGDELAFTVSIGVAGMQPGWQAGDLVRAADKALYSAKNSGRNLVVSYQELTHR